MEEISSGHTHTSSRNLLYEELFAGAVSGTVADALTYPMMTIKSRLQVQGSSAVNSIVKESPSHFMYKGPFDAFRTIIAKEGWRTLYKGYGTVVQVAPAQALYMGSYQFAKRNLPGGMNNPRVHFLGGIIATLIQSSITVPLEVVRIRQMVQTKLLLHDSYRNSLHAFSTIFKEEGVSALYRGFWLAQMVWGPYNAIYLPLWEFSKLQLSKAFNMHSVEDLSLKHELLCSFSCAAIAATLTNPMDIVKTRLQAQGKSNVSSSTRYDNAFHAARSILHNEGAMGFFKGVSSRIMWVATTSMIFFTTYDQLIKFLE